VLAIAPAEIIRNASETPIVRRIGIASTSPFAGHPLVASNGCRAASQSYWMDERVRIGVFPGLSPTIQAEQVGRCEAKRDKTGLSTLLFHFPTHCELGAVLAPQR
jgi:hypothetical protein